MRFLILHILTLLLSVSFCKAQQNISLKEMTAIMQKANSIYSQKEFAVAIEVYTYKGHYAVAPEDQSDGVIRKKNNLIEQSLNHTYSLQNKTMKIIVDSAENIVGITFPDTTSFSFTPNDDFFKKYNKYVSNISISDNQNGVQLLNIHYREGMPYEKISIKLNQDFAEEITFFYTKKVEYETADGKISEEKPKLRVVLRKLPSVGNLNYNMNEIAYQSNDGYRLGGKFKNFKLIDFRYQN
jgi:hypothetical protein